VTQLAGDITTDATWAGDLTVTGDVTIKAGATVTVAAGSHLSAGTAGIVVEGTLLVQGAAGQIVTFDAVSNSWTGIRVASGGHATIAYATITKAGTAIDCAAGAATCALDHVNITSNVRSGQFASVATIAYSTLEKTTSNGISVLNGANVTITDTHLTTAGGDIVVQNGGTLKIDYAEIGKVLDSYEHCGIHINAAESLIIEHTQLHSNVYGAMIGQTTNARINYSNWEQNGTDIDDLGGNTGLDLKNNYWSGTPSSAGVTTGASATPLTAGPRP
jgi:hypothetical protein